jgi:hypothetical protein
VAMTGLNEWPINFKPYAATQATPANAHVWLLRDADIFWLGEES